MTYPIKMMIETFLTFLTISVNYCNKYYDGGKIFYAILVTYMLEYHYFFSIYYLLLKRPQFDSTV